MQLLVAWLCMTLRMSLTCEAHRPPPSSGHQLSRSVAWTLGRRVSPSAKKTLQSKSTHWGDRILLTVRRLSGSALASVHYCLGCKGSNLWWIQPPMRPSRTPHPRSEGGLWRMTCYAMLLFCFCFSVILSPVEQWLTDSCDWVLSDSSEWRIFNVSHESWWYNSVFTDCLVVSRHNMLQDNQDLWIMIVGYFNCHC